MNNKPRTIRYMLVILLLLLAVNMCLYPGSAGAAEQKGHIMDHASLFAEEDISRMNARLDHHTYDLYVITGTGMSESEGMKLANEVYEQAGFSGNQLLLMITTDPNYVHLVFDNEELSERIARSNAGSIAGVTDSQFVPYAKKGDLAGGVIAVSDYLNGLGDVSSPDTSSALSAAGQPPLSEQNGKSLRQVIFYIIGGCVAAALLVLLIVRAVASEKLHRRQKRLRARVDEWNERLDSLSHSDSSGSLDKGMLGGFSAAAITARKLDIQKYSSQLDRLRQCIDSRNISLFSTTRPAKELQGLEQQLNAQAVQIEEWLKYSHSSGIADNSHPLVENSELAGQSWDGAVDELSGQSPEQQSRLWLDDIEHAERELRWQIEQEQLMINTDNPFPMLDQARSEAEYLPNLLARGDIDSIRRIEQHIREARSLVADLIRYRDDAREMLTLAPQQLEQLQLQPERYEQEVELLREQYARVHIQEQRDRYARMQELQFQVEQLLPKIADALDEHDQQYRHANVLTTEVRTALDQIHHQRNAILGYRDELDLHKKLLMENWELMSARHREGVQLLTGIPEEGLAALQSQNESFHMLEQVRRRLINPPIHLPELEEAMMLAAARLDAFLQDVQEIIGISDLAQQPEASSTDTERPGTPSMRLFRNHPEDNHE